MPSLDTAHPGAAPPREGVVLRLAKGLADLSFRRSVVVDGAGAIYVLWIAASVLPWLLAIVASLWIGLAPNPDDYFGRGMRAPWLPLMVILLGWLPVLVQVVLGRAVLELLTSSVRAAVASQRTAELLAERHADPDLAASTRVPSPLTDTTTPDPRITS